MLELSDILQLKPKSVPDFGGRFMLARPSVADLMELTHHNERDPVYARLWTLSRHILNADGSRAFDSPEAAKACPAAVAAKLFPMIEALYSEGLD